MFRSMIIDDHNENIRYLQAICHKEIKRLMENGNKDAIGFSDEPIFDVDDDLDRS